MQRYGVVWTQNAFQSLYPSDHGGYNVLDEFKSFHTSHNRRHLIDCVKLVWIKCDGYATYETGLKFVQDVVLYNGDLFSICNTFSTNTFHTFVEFRLAGSCKQSPQFRLIISWQIPTFQQIHTFDKFIRRRHRIVYLELCTCDTWNKPFLDIGETHAPIKICKVRGIYFWKTAWEKAGILPQW